MKAEIMKKTCGIRRENRRLVASTFTFVNGPPRSKKGRKAFPDFSKNPHHFSKNFPALTLNFENFSDLFFCEQNPPPPKSSQTVRSPRAPAAVAPERRFGVPR